LEISNKNLDVVDEGMIARVHGLVFYSSVCFSERRKVKVGNFQQKS
jgi:hypothetical protein